MALESQCVKRRKKKCHTTIVLRSNVKKKVDCLTRKKSQNSKSGEPLELDYVNINELFFHAKFNFQISKIYIYYRS